MLKPIYFAPLLVLALLPTAAAQESAPATQTSTLTITAAATGDAVRITAPSSVVQLHVEVYASSGEKLFDQEIRGGNVFDWHLQDGQAQRLAAGDYVCVITAKAVSGKITQKVGAVTVAANSASVRAGDAQQFTSPQAQAIGPVEANSSWTIVAEGENKTTTVIANTGSEGQMIRGRGALTFRLGDFFSGKDEEQMRLTEEGNLGLGTTTPQAKLDVAGTIRAERFLIVKPGASGGGQTMAATATTDASNSLQPLVGGSGTTGRLTKWTDGPSGTLGDSVITETAGGNVGIGTSPGGLFEIWRATSPSMYITRDLSAGSGKNQSLTLGIDGAGGRAYIDSTHYSNGGYPLDFRIRGNPYMTVDVGGNVGVGTTAPQARLDVEAIDGAGSQATEVLRIGKGTMDAGGDEAFINLANGPNTLGRVGVVAEGASTGDLYLSVNNAGAVSKALTAKFNGNVGIGNTNPFAKLDVAGDINTTTQFKLGGFPILSSPGTSNLFAGVSAGFLSTGSFNSFFGPFSGFNASGNNNSFFGNGSGSGSSTGSNNSFFGVSSGLSDTTGFDNAFFGFQSGLNNKDGVINTFIGDNAGRANTLGSENTFIGASAGLTNNTGQLNTTIGYRADVGSANLIYATAIGAGAQVSQSNSLVLGAINGFNSATTDTYVGIGTTSPANSLDVNGVGTQFGGVSGFSEVAARFRNRTAGTHSAVSIDALSGQDAVLYLAENGAAVWGIRNDSDQGGKFQIRLQSGGVNTPLFSLNPTGEVGLGTTTPNATLQVISTTTEQVLSATSNLTTGTYFNLGNTGTSGNTWNFISTGTAASQGGPGKLYIKDNNAGLVRAAFDTKGNLGIGTNAPNAKLHVVQGDVAITTQSFGVILRATDDGTGTKCFRLTVNSAGTLSTFALACP